jgi:hypothetical protein
VTVLNFLSPGGDALVPCPKCDGDADLKCDLCKGFGEMAANPAADYIDQRIRQMEKNNGNDS